MNYVFRFLKVHMKRLKFVEMRSKNHRQTISAGYATPFFQRFGLLTALDGSGRELFHRFIDGKAKMIRICLPVLNPGVYLCRIESRQELRSFNGKLIKE